MSNWLNKIILLFKITMQTSIAIEYHQDNESSIKTKRKNRSSTETDLELKKQKRENFFNTNKFKEAFTIESTTLENICSEDMDMDKINVTIRNLYDDVYDNDNNLNKDATLKNNYENSYQNKNVLSVFNILSKDSNLTNFGNSYQNKKVLTVFDILSKNSNLTNFEDVKNDNSESNVNLNENQKEFNQHSKHFNREYQIVKLNDDHREIDQNTNLECNEYQMMNLNGDHKMFKDVLEIINANEFEQESNDSNDADQTNFNIKKSVSDNQMSNNYSNTHNLQIELYRNFRNSTNTFGIDILLEASNILEQKSIFLQKIATVLEHIKKFNFLMKFFEVRKIGNFKENPFNNKNLRETSLKKAVSNNFQLISKMNELEQSSNSCNINHNVNLTTRIFDDFVFKIKFCKIINEFQNDKDSYIRHTAPVLKVIEAEKLKMLESETGIMTDENERVKSISRFISNTERNLTFPNKTGLLYESHPFLKTDYLKKYLNKKIVYKNKIVFEFLLVHLVELSEYCNDHFSCLKNILVDFTCFCKYKHLYYEVNSSKTNGYSNKLSKCNLFESNMNNTINYKNNNEIQNNTENIGLVNEDTNIRIVNNLLNPHHTAILRSDNDYFLKMFYNIFLLFSFYTENNTSSFIFTENEHVIFKIFSSNVAMFYLTIVYEKEIALSIISNPIFLNKFMLAISNIFINRISTNKIKILKFNPILHRLFSNEHSCMEVLDEIFALIHENFQILKKEFDLKI